MAKKVFGVDHYPIGEILNNNLYAVSNKFGILNSTNFPIGINNLNTDLQRKFSQIKDIGKHELLGK